MRGDAVSRSRKCSPVQLPDQAWAIAESDGNKENANSELCESCSNSQMRAPYLIRSQCCTKIICLQQYAFDPLWVVLELAKTQAGRSDIITMLYLLMLQASCVLPYPLIVSANAQLCPSNCSSSFNSNPPSFVTTAIEYRSKLLASL